MNAGAVAPPGFEEAFRALYPRALGVARRILGDAALAEDVTAEAWVRTFVRWRRVRDLPHRDGWVLRVTTNLALDAARNRARPARAVATRAPAEEADVVAMRAALVAALASLPRRQRDAIALRFLGDLSEADTALAMGVSAGAVKTHVHRGIASLRERFGPTLEETFDVHI